MSVLAFVLDAWAFLVWLPGLIAGLTRKRWDVFWGCCAAANGMETIGDCLRGSWGWAAFTSAMTLMSIWYWHQERRKRGKRKVAEAIGEKSRALRDALVRKARQAARPNPVLRPSLKGAS